MSKVVWEKPTFYALAQLRDNYTSGTGHTETETQQVCALFLFGVGGMDVVRLV